MPPTPDEPLNSKPHVDAADCEEVIISAGPLGREDIEDAPFWKEVAAFNRIPQSLVDEFYGQYVAVYDGRIVDHDPDEGELALRFYRTWGYVPVYIHKVGTEEGLIETDDF
jgi:hypothetical protein